MHLTRRQERTRRQGRSGTARNLAWYFKTGKGQYGHGDRSTALEILVAQHQREKSQTIFDFYLKHTKFVNNWDLVDGSAPYIVGQHLLRRSPSSTPMRSTTPSLSPSFCLKMTTT